MKKLLLLAAFGVAGIMSANTITPTSDEGNLEFVLENHNKVAFEATPEYQCGTFYASCTAAYTCQSWTESQWIQWAELIQENYCQLW